MKTLFLLTFMIISLKAFSHPVIYKDGWALNSSNMEDYSNNYILYSFTNRFAVGVENNRFDDRDFTSLKFNTLLYRYNGDESQANAYFHGALGELHNYGLETDWESRVLYTSWKHLRYENGRDYSVTQGRIGISPKKAPFENLQTWFMVQGMILHGVDERVMITPMLRFFYQNVLWEVGSSTRGDWMLNLMVHL